MCVFRRSLRLKSVREGFPHTDARPLSTGRSIAVLHRRKWVDSRARLTWRPHPSLARPLSRLSHSLSLWKVQGEGPGPVKGVRLATSRRAPSKDEVPIEKQDGRLKAVEIN